MARSTPIALLVALAIAACGKSGEDSRKEASAGEEASDTAAPTEDRKDSAEAGGALPGPDATSDIPTGETAVEPSPTKPQVPRVPPSLGGQALGDELLKAGTDATAQLEQVRGEEKALEVQRAALEKLAADIAQTRTKLRDETERLKALIVEAQRSQESTAQSTGQESAGDDSSRSSGKVPADFEADPERLDTLARAVRGMKPDQAATLLEKLPKGLAANLLLRMRGSDAAQVLEKLKPDFAAELVGEAARPPPRRGE